MTMNVIGASVSEAIYASHETRDIVLPNQTEHASQIAVDVNKYKQKCQNSTNVRVGRLVVLWLK